MWLLVNQGGSQTLSFIGTLYLARVLGASSFGIYSLALAVGQYLGVLGDFGTSIYGMRQIASCKGRSSIIYPQLLTMRITASMAVFFLFWLILYCLKLEQHTYWMILWGGFFVIFNAINSDWFFKGIERMEWVAAGNLIISITFIISILFMVHDEGDGSSAIFLRSFAYLPGGLFMFFMIRSRISFSGGSWFSQVPRLMFKESFSYMLTGGIGSFYIYSYILILGFFVDDVTLGFFSVAYRLLLVIILFGSVLPMAFFPILADLHLKDQERFKSVHSFFRTVLLIVSLPITATAGVFAPEIIRSFFGQDFVASTTIFRLLTLAIPLIFLRFAYGQGLLACGHQKTHLSANAGGCIVAGIATTCLSPKLGGEGAALAFLVGEATLFTLMFISFKKHNSWTFPRVRNCFIIAGSALTMLTIMLYSDLYYVFRIILGVSIYSLIVFFSGILTTNSSLLGLTQEKAC